MKLRHSIDPITLILSIAMGLQLVIIGLYIGLLVCPFYYNGLQMQPAVKVESGSFDPMMLVPFCHIPPDGAEGSPGGDELHAWAVLIAWLGPVLLIALDILVVVFLIKGWPVLRLSERVIGLVHLMVSLGAFGFLGITGLGHLFLDWI